MRFAFVMEQQAGMRTHYLNWRHIVAQEPDVASNWIPVTYYEEGGWIERLRFLPRGVRGTWRGYLQVERGLGRTKYDAVLFNTHNPAVIHRRSLREQRVFLMFDVTSRQYDGMSHLYGYGHRADRPGLIADYKHRRVKETFRAAAGLMAWSRWAAQSAVEEYGVDPASVSLVPPGVDTQLWQPAPPDCKPNDGITRLLFTGGNFVRKGGDLLLRWARQTRRTDWELHVVTLDPVDAPPGVVVHNDLGSNAAELVALAQQCDLFVLPTRADCFSIASLEAMAAGLPLITTNVGGIPDIVREGETGFLLNADDYDGLCDRIDVLLDAPDLREKMGRRGREIVCAEFEAKTLVQRGLSIMKGGL
jgi:glycosyltransferase involved in cell wall biosynthesis